MKWNNCDNTEYNKRYRAATTDRPIEQHSTIQSIVKWSDNRVINLGNFKKGKQNKTKTRFSDLSLPCKHSQSLCSSMTIHRTFPWFVNRTEYSTTSSRGLGSIDRHLSTFSNILLTEQPIDQSFKQSTDQSIMTAIISCSPYEFSLHRHA